MLYPFWRSPEPKKKDSFQHDTDKVEEICFRTKAANRNYHLTQLLFHIFKFFTTFFKVHTLFVQKLTNLRLSASATGGNGNEVEVSSPN